MNKITYLATAFLLMNLIGCVGDEIAPPEPQPVTLADEICTESRYPPPFEGGTVIATEVVTPGNSTRNYEGPLWLEDSQTLLLCDRPSGDAEGFNVLAVSGGQTSTFAEGVSCGGLAFFPDKKSAMVAVGRNSGKAQIGKLDLQTQAFETIAEDASGEALTNPNDVTVTSGGIGYVSDNAADTVYKVAVDGTTSIAKTNLSKANGVSLSPLYGAFFV